MRKPGDGLRLGATFRNQIGPRPTMSIRLLNLLMVLALAVPSSGYSALASPPPQNHRSKSDANINAIGHRRIEHGPNLYSSEREKEIGKMLAEETERSYKFVNDPAIIEYIERVAQNLAKNSDAQMPITVAVIDSDDVNAFTLPGGYQYVSRGLLLELEGDAELASVIARGIAHTALRSATMLATKGGITNMAITPAAKVATGDSTGTAASQAVLVQIALMRREDEMDADYFGVQYMYKAGYDPKGLMNLVQRIGNASSSPDREVFEPLRSFPPVNERLAALRKEISAILPPQPDAVVSTPEFDEFKARLPARNSEPRK
jgi:predicted Zn-dependent protease